ncbi:putative voltage-dependent anion-selective channel [Trypanosoma rangeli]|uniref:Putative voltage-dependent anion-selective channel n=1 Tax=Trypanosoma rangeli TaxID=5698 RepID=A0A3R7M1M0_TRYRA|nr:putative voltage-dependent anion-selective channel [Trypanosoma rangeli]RNF07368.1 putative voltage-dependent anion-selective channel [Trypanosoma rangeli]|eukprot:RNF07368.1 putative voltage-dependent anion-selective channel [Trypanosoma rangeli]
MPAMFPVTKSLTLYKDFNKDAKDMLTKNYTESRKWKLESKFKGPKDRLFVNPSATSDGKFSVDVEYVAGQCDLGVKATLHPDINNAGLKVTYPYKGHKVEASVKKNGEYEVSHEFVLGGHMSSHARLVKNAVEMSLVAAVASQCQVGCGVTYQLDGKQGCEWTAAYRYAEAGRVVTVRTNKLRTYTASIVSPMPTVPHPVVVGAEVVCGHGQGWTGTLGLETACVLFKGNALKARVNKNKEWAVAYIAKLADNWTAAVTVDKNLKPGVLLTHS